MPAVNLGRLGADWGRRIAYSCKNLTQSAWPHAQTMRVLQCGVALLTVLAVVEAQPHVNKVCCRVCACALGPDPARAREIWARKPGTPALRNADSI